MSALERWNFACLLHAAFGGVAAHHSTLCPLNFLDVELLMSAVYGSFLTPFVSKVSFMILT